MLSTYDERSKERVGHDTPSPPQVTTIRLSCNKNGSYIEYPELDAFKNWIANPPQSIMGAYHLWSAVCEARFPMPGKEMEFQVK